MATSKTFTVTGTKNGTTFTVDLSSDKIIFVRANGSGADIHYDDSGLRKVITVDQTPAAISVASDFLIAVTDNAEGDTLYINADRVMAVNTARTTEADILYRVIGHSQVVLEVDESKASIQTAISAIVSNGGGDVTTGYTAHAGGGQADATQLGYGYSEVTTVATTGDSVKIPVAVNGARVEVLNEGANTMDLYPATGDTINDGAANSPIPVPPGVSIVLTAIDGTNWETSGQKYAAGDGTVALPSFTFTSDPDSGMYRIGANNIGVAVNAAKVLDISTAGLGVTGELRYSGLQVGSSTTSITAFATGGQANAVLLTTGYNEITTCATAGDSVKLPALGATSGGTICVVKNNGATAADVFPNTSDNINALAINLAVRIAPGATIEFRATGSATWQTNDSVIAAGNGSAAAPSITFENSPTAGLFNNGATGVGISAGGVQTVDVKTTGVDFLVGDISYTALVKGGLTTGITAFATGGQANAVLLTTEYNEISVCATAGDSVKLPALGAPSAGFTIIIKNNGATAADVFPFAGDAIDALAANTAVRLAPNATISFKSISSSTWESSIEVIAAEAGSAAAPSITFNAQPDQGLYNISSTQMGLSVGGALATVADTSGLLSDSVRNRVNLGTTPVGTVSIVEYGDGRDITTVLTLTNFIVGALAGAAANLGIGNIVYAFPAGQHMELVYSLSSISLTAAGTAVNTDTGLGSVIASGAVAVLSGTATFEDRLTGQTIATAPGGGAAVSALTAATAGIGTGIALNGTGAVKNVFLNSAGAWNVDNTGNLTASGTIILKWTKMS